MLLNDFRDPVPAIQISCYIPHCSSKKIDVLFVIFIFMRHEHERPDLSDFFERASRARSHQIQQADRKTAGPTKLFCREREGEGE